MDIFFHLRRYISFQRDASSATRRIYQLKKELDSGNLDPEFYQKIEEALKERKKAATQAANQLKNEAFRK